MCSQAKAIDAKSKGLQWPNMMQLGDPIRAMVICGHGKYEQPKQVWDAIDAQWEAGYGRLAAFRAVSYTHLALPTKAEVEVSVVAG